MGGVPGQVSRNSLEEVDVRGQCVFSFILRSAAGAISKRRVHDEGDVSF